MDENFIIEKIGWITQRKSIPPLTKEYIERQYRFFENYIHFLQDNGFTTRIILNSDEKANDDSELWIKDLTEEGFKFYKYGIIKWREKYDKAKNKDKAINDFAFIEKKLKEFREKQNG
ncbi:hypothetical protein Bacsa_1065 [Phocaeicola salanitronis DSM 18170]|uniref:Cyclopropane-fatty-acyl-phospholipid synthase n=1 Tax=Phocaeicola salanitronis (strain DSM 18170 / JCM 13657 / CCUG 60908 / BL78) TaxID=667015 RepID=F0R4T9_PHOSB|nr:hypothetical protein [Phocaeicola salanitronis]ADY35653.1 hypothetical protein Bacsa_1065 [Phocaeicola salanitronis DSM 18170]